jgi:hypothetical protein
MRVGTLVELGFLSALLGCSGSQTVVGSSVGESPTQAEAVPPPSATPPAVAGAPAVAAQAQPIAPAADEGPEPTPPPDPALVKALLEKTGEPGSDNPLHLRLEVTPRPAGELWLVGVVNRGTEVAKVKFDLRRLTLTLTPPEAAPPSRGGWHPKPKKIVCKLPEGFGGHVEALPPEVLEPGEGLVQTFDPRLYCISTGGDSQLATGQRLTPRLGFAPKPPRVLWKQGKRVEAPSQQVAPFIAEPASLEPTASLDAEHDPRVKELVGSEILVSPELTNAEAEEDPSLPLQFRLLHGSDAATEMSATTVVQVRARKKSQLYFRRELVSFMVHGPEGIRGCDPEPDERAPDRQAYVTLGAGQSVSATSLLAELCPKFTFGRPGLYLVSARMDAERDGSEFGLSAFTGRLESRKEALVRIRTGELPALPAPEPLRVRVGQ